MAIYHCHVSVFSRAKGRSAVEEAAYRERGKIKDERTGITYDYSHKSDLIYAEIFTPNKVPDWMKNRHTLWNRAEKGESRKDAQTAREIEFSLPAEFSKMQNILLAKEIAESFVAKGMIADLTMHDNDTKKPHAHIMLTMRPITDKGEWGAKSTSEYILDKNGKKIKLQNGNYKSRKINMTDWDNKENIEIWRKLVATKTNEHLKMHGFDIKIDHRSYERQGIERIPTIHLGVIAHQLELRGIETNRGNINRQIMEDNRRLEAVNKELENINKEFAELQDKEKIAGQGRKRKGEPASESSFEDLYKQHARKFRRPIHRQKSALVEKREYNQERELIKSHISTLTPHHEEKELSTQRQDIEFENLYKPQEQIPELKPHHEANLENRYKQPPDHERQRQEQTPEPQPKPYHEVEFEDRYKRPSALKKNKGIVKTHKP